MRDPTWGDAKWKAWQAIEKSVLYDEHAEGCTEDEDIRLHAEADNSLDELWSFMVEHYECPQCKMKNRVAKAQTEWESSLQAKMVIDLRSKLMAEICNVSGKTEEDIPKVVSLVGKLMMAVRMGNR